LSERVDSSRPRARDAETRLIERYRKTGDRAVLDELTASLMPWLSRVVGRFSNRGLDRDDLFQVASVGLVKAIERFEPGRGVQFTTFAEPTVTGEIKRHFRDFGWAVRPPRSLQELSVAVTRAVDLLTVELKHPPTVNELAAHLNVSADQVLEAMNASSAYHADSLDVPEDEEHKQPVAAQVDAAFAVTDRRVMLGRAMEVLSQRDRLIMHMSFFEDLTQAEISERVGISQMQVSRVIRSSLAKLRASLEADDAEAAQS
jgi:RNA polymerase sigma-B factor